MKTTRNHVNRVLNEINLTLMEYELEDKIKEITVNRINGNTQISIHIDVATIIIECSNENNVVKATLNKTTVTYSDLTKLTALMMIVNNRINNICTSEETRQRRVNVAKH